MNRASPSCGAIASASARMSTYPRNSKVCKQQDTKFLDLKYEIWVGDGQYEV